MSSTISKSPARRLPLPRVIEGRGLVLVLVTALTIIAFSLFLPGFLTLENWTSLVRSVSVLGILGVGAAIVIIAGGIDISVVAIMAATAGWFLQMTQDDLSVIFALAACLGLALSVGIVNGVLVAFFEMPALLVTIGTAMFLSGLTKLILVKQSVVYVPEELADLRFIGQGYAFGIPLPVIAFACFVALGYLFLTKTRIGHFLFAQGDNRATAEIIGLPTRPVMVLVFMVSALIALCAGLITAAAAGGMNVQISNGTLIFDVILVAVIGGVSLSGGQGGVLGVAIGALLIGVLLNGMTLMNLNNIYQDLFKALALLLAIVWDNLLHPVDPETARDGDL